MKKTGAHWNKGDTSLSLNRLISEFSPGCHLNAKIMFHTIGSWHQAQHRCIPRIQHRRDSTFTFMTFGDFDGALPTAALQSNVLQASSYSLTALVAVSAENCIIYYSMVDKRTDSPHCLGEPPRCAFQICNLLAFEYKSTNGSCSSSSPSEHRMHMISKKTRPDIKFTCT